jgi:hypothetical protein
MTKREVTMAVPDIGGTWSSRDAEKVAGMYTENGVRHQIALPEGRFQGREAIAGAAGGLIGVVPDEVVEIRKVTEGSNGTVLVEWVFKGRTRATRPAGRPRTRRSSSWASACATWRATSSRRSASTGTPRRAGVLG